MITNDELLATTEYWTTRIRQRVSQLLYATSNNNDDQYRFAS